MMSQSNVSVIQYKLKSLKLTRAGKIRLTPFTSKVLYKALSCMQRTFNAIPEYPYNIYYALCFLEADRLKEEPDWDAIKKFPNFCEESVATTENEAFDMKKCYQFMDRYRNNYTKKYTKSTHRSKYGPTFKEGVTYWKHGIEYKYPDQALHKDSNPAPQDPTYRAPLPQDAPERVDIDQVEQLKKAIRIGKINKKGLSFLRRTYIGRPELLEIIDACLQLDVDDDVPLCDQRSLPF